MPADLAQELGARKGQDVPGPAGPEGRYQGGGADLRDAEELLGSVAGVSSSRSSFSSYSMASGIASSQLKPSEHRCRLRTHGRYRQPVRQSRRRSPPAPFAFESARIAPSTTLLLVAGERESNCE